MSLEKIYRETISQLKQQILSILFTYSISTMSKEQREFNWLKIEKQAQIEKELFWGGRD